MRATRVRPHKRRTRWGRTFVRQHLRRNPKKRLPRKARIEFSNTGRDDDPLIAEIEADGDRQVASVEIDAGGNAMITGIASSYPELKETLRATEGTTLSPELDKLVRE